MATWSEKSSKTFFILLLLSQLEESNTTLTKDVEHLSKEKAELDEKLTTQEEGTWTEIIVASLIF